MICVSATENKSECWSVRCEIAAERDLLCLFIYDNHHRHWQVVGMEQNEQEKQKRNPRENSTIFGILTFWYTREIFRVGYSKILEIKDLYLPLHEDESGLLGDRLEK